MKRITGWDKENAYCLACFAGDGCEDMETSKCDFCDEVQAVYRKCAAYEDTGATPEACKAALVLQNSVVRCADCQWAEPYTAGALACTYHQTKMEVADYCSRGERRHESNY